MEAELSCYDYRTRERLKESWCSQGSNCSPFFASAEYWCSNMVMPRLDFKQTWKFSSKSTRDNVLHACVWEEVQRSCMLSIMYSKIYRKAQCTV